MNSTYNPYAVLSRSKPLFSRWSCYPLGLSRDDVPDLVFLQQGPASPLPNRVVAVAQHIDAVAASGPSPCNRSVAGLITCCIEVALEDCRATEGPDEGTMKRRGLSEIVDWDRRWRHIRIWHLRKRRHRSSATPWIRVTHHHPLSHPIHRHSRMYRNRRSRSHYRRGSEIQPSLPQNSIGSCSLLSSDIMPQPFHFLFLRHNLLLHEKFHFVELV